MSGNLSPYPIWQFFDQNGNPLVNGSVTWYSAGTNHLAPIYADQALEIQLPNPLHLDAAGRPRTGSGPTPVWVDGNKAYKQVHRDAQNRVLWTADNLVSPGTGLPGPPGPPGDTGPPGLMGPSGGPMGAAYLQGSWLPILTTQLGPGGGEFGQVYGFQQAFFTKVGRVVVVSGRLHLTTRGTWPSDTPLVLSGLPYPVAVGDGTAGAVYFHGYALAHGWLSVHGVATTDPHGFMIEGRPSDQLDNIQTLPMEENALADGTELAFAGHYLTNAEPTPPPGPGEGTFTPELIGLEGQSGQSYARQVGFYRKLGSLVFVFGDFRLSARGNFGSTIGIGGLPFSVIESNFQFPDAGMVSIGSFDSLPTDRAMIWLSGVAISSPPCLWLRGKRSPGHQAGSSETETFPIYQDDLTDTTAMAFNGFYRTDPEGD